MWLIDSWPQKPFFALLHLSHNPSPVWDVDFWRYELKRFLPFLQSNRLRGHLACVASLSVSPCRRTCALWHYSWTQENSAQVYSLRRQQYEPLLCGQMPLPSCAATRCDFCRRYLWDMYLFDALIITTKVPFCSAVHHLGPERSGQRFMWWSHTDDSYDPLGQMMIEGWSTTYLALSHRVGKVGQGSCNLCVSPEEHSIRQIKTDHLIRSSDHQCHPKPGSSHPNSLVV